MQVCIVEVVCRRKLMPQNACVQTRAAMLSVLVGMRMVIYVRRILGLGTYLPQHCNIISSIDQKWQPYVGVMLYHGFAIAF